MQTPPLPPALVEPSSLSLSEARLTDDESHALRAHEATIAAGRETFLQVGSALLEIHDRRLYRESHQTFEHYVQDRWDFSRQHAYRLITAAGVAKNLSPTGDITELNERQTRALARLAAEDQPVVFELAKTMAPSGRITSSHLKNLVTVAQQVMETGAIGGGASRGTRHRLSKSWHSFRTRLMPNDNTSNAIRPAAPSPRRRLRIGIHRPRIWCQFGRCLEALMSTPRAVRWRTRRFKQRSITTLTLTASPTTGRGGCS